MSMATLQAARPRRERTHSDKIRYLVIDAELGGSRTQSDAHEQLQRTAVVQSRDFSLPRDLASGSREGVAQAATGS
jgi:hypothetical protein